MDLKREFFNVIHDGDLAKLKAMSEEQISFDWKDDDDRSGIHWAASQGRVEIISYLIQKGADHRTQDDGGWTPLMSATSAGHIEAVRILLAAQPAVDCNAVNERGCTALHYACSKGRVEIVEELLAHGAKVSIRNRSGDSPVHRAAVGGHASVVALLLTRGASPYATNSSKQTPLHLAVMEGHVAVALQLMRAGADLADADGDGLTALQLVRQEDMRKILQEAGSRKE